jgi:alpha-methylacyl-CoA racemase
VKQPAPAPRFSRTPGRAGARPKPPGSDTVEALTDWGIEDTRIKQLLEAGAVTQAEPT